jgi:hypothetical protein
MRQSIKATFDHETRDVRPPPLMEVQCRSRAKFTRDDVGGAGAARNERGFLSIMAFHTERAS